MSEYDEVRCILQGELDHLRESLIGKVLFEQGSKIVAIKEMRVWARLRGFDTISLKEIKDLVDEYLPTLQREVGSLVRQDLRREIQYLDDAVGRALQQVEKLKGEKEVLQGKLDSLSRTNNSLIRELDSYEEEARERRSEELKDDSLIGAMSVLVEDVASEELRVAMCALLKRLS